MVSIFTVISGAAAAYTLFGPGKEAPTKVQEIAQDREREADAILKTLTPEQRAIEARRLAKEIIRKDILPEKRAEILKSPEELKKLVTTSEGIAVAQRQVVSGQINAERVADAIQQKGKCLYMGGIFAPTHWAGPNPKIVAILKARGWKEKAETVGHMYLCPPIASSVSKLAPQ